MKTLGYILLIISISYVSSGCGCKTEMLTGDRNTSKFAFYNLENLFDTLNDPHTADDEFTPTGKKAWNGEKYKAKIHNISEVISSSWGLDFPDVLGLCEIENKTVLNDLTVSLEGGFRYAVLHSDSPDERGIDVALLFNPEKYSLLDSGYLFIKLSSRPADRTRDILWASLRHTGTDDTIRVFVCHFPSRRKGAAASADDRTDAASQCRKFISERYALHKNHIVIMGDMNDNPSDPSVFSVLGARHPDENSSDLYNLFMPHQQRGKGSYLYRGDWYMYDQILVSASLLDGKLPDAEKTSAVIEDNIKLFQKGKYAGMPYRNFAGNKWLNGYSDHLPVSCKIRLN